MYLVPIGNYAPLFPTEIGQVKFTAQLPLNVKGCSVLGIMATVG